MSALSILFDTKDIGQPLAPDHPDAELMERIGCGDAAAFETLYTALYPRLFRFIYRMIRHTDLAEDLINETMLVVWEKPGGFDYSCKVSTWIFAIAYRKTLKACCKSARTTADLPLDEFAEVFSDGKPSATRQVELDNLVVAALDTLSPEQRAVMELAYYHELPYREIAEILDCPENTVKTRMFHARKKLQPFLQDLTPDPSDYRNEDRP